MKNCRKNLSFFKNCLDYLGVIQNGEGVMKNRCFEIKFVSFQTDPTD